MSVNGSGPDASDAAEKFADDLGEKLNNPTGGLTTGVKIVDDKGNDTGKTKPRFILQSHGYYGKTASMTTLPRYDLTYSVHRCEGLCSSWFGVSQRCS